MTGLAGTKRILAAVSVSAIFFPVAAAGLPSAAEAPVAAGTVQRLLFTDLARRCGSGVHHNTLQAVARVESRFNPYAIGVVKGALRRQPQSLDEAVRAARMLHAQGRNFSMGLMQVNKGNLKRYGLNYETVFDPCRNIDAGAKILEDCFARSGGGSQAHLQKAFSCYYSGNFRFGFSRDFKGQPSYVQKVLNAATQNTPQQTVRVPAVVPGVQQVPAARPSDAKKNRSRSDVRRVAPQAQADDAPAVAVPADNGAAAPPKEREVWDVFGDF